MLKYVISVLLFSMLLSAGAFSVELHQGQVRSNAVATEADESVLSVEGAYSASGYNTVRLTNNAAESANPRVVVDADFVYVVWCDWRDGFTGAEIYWKKTDWAGNEVVSDQRITNTSGACSVPDIGVDGSGRSFICWQQGSSIMFIGLDNSGTPLFSPVTVSSGGCERPAIATHVDGQSTIVFDRDEGILRKAYMVRYNSSGTVTCSLLNLSPGDLADYAKHAAVDLDPLGHAYASWFDIYNWDDGLWISKRLATCTQQANYRYLSTGEQPNVAVAVPSENYFFSFMEQTISGRKQVMCLAASLINISNSPGVARLPRIASVANGECYAVWYDNRDANNEIYMAVTDGNCGITSGPTRLTDDAASSINPDIDVYPGTPNDLWVVWQDYRNGNGEIYMTTTAAPASTFCDGFSGIFCDDFRDDVITEWQSLRDDGCLWEESNGTLSTSNVGDQQWCILTVGDANWEFYALEAKVRGNGGVDKVVAFQIQDQNNFYAVNLRSDYPSAGIDQLTFDKMVDGVYQADLAVVDCPSENGVWYTIRVHCWGNYFEVFVDDALKLTYSDNDSPYYSGGIGVACWTGYYGSCGVSFDDVAVTPVPIAPCFTSTPVCEAVVGESYMYDAEAVGYPDPVYTLTVAPDGMMIDEISGIIDWVPETAGDYPVTIVASNVAGDAFQSYTISVGEEVICGDLGFRPDPDGWQFENSEGNMWPETWWEQFDYTDPQYPFAWGFTCNSSDFPDWPLFVSAFGQDQCYFNPPPGLIIYRPSAVLRWFALKGDWGGSCFGFAISSFLFFDNRLDVASEFPGATNLYDVPLEEESRRMVNMYWIYQFGRETQAHRNTNWNTTTPSQTLEACQNMFNSGSGDNRALSFWNNGNGGGGHTVNPYRCEQSDTNDDLWYIYIYDNNYPGDVSRRIEVNTATDTWYYAALPQWGGSELVFLELPSSSFVTNPTMPKSIPPKEEWTTELVYAASAVSEDISVFHSATDEIIIEAGSGEIGYIGDSLFNTVTNGMPIIPTTGTDMIPIGYYLPNVEWSAQITSQSDSAFHLSIFTDSTVLAYHRDSVAANDMESIRYFGNDSSVIVHNDNLSDISYSLDVISILPDSEIVCGVRNILTSVEDSVQYSISPLSGLVIDNYGQATTYAVRVQIVGVDSDTVFYHADVAIESNTTHSLVPDWRINEDSLIVLVDAGMTGEYDDTLTLVNEGEPSCCQTRGDVDHNGVFDPVDVVFFVEWLWASGPNPPCIDEVDADGSGQADPSDLIYLVEYMWNSGPAPVPCP